MLNRQDVPEDFGRYRLLSRLGVGGMGTVFLALDSQLDRQVALKIPHLEADTDAVLVERFRREATLAARISHPNLCPVHDVGSFAGFPYLTMPYIEGTPLSRLLGPERPWSPRDAALLVRQVAMAVGQLHANGIIHRDLKPANIMIRPSGEPMLMDFGLALSVEAARLTRQGEPVGTPAYMAPEQVRGDVASLGPTTDVYSLGVLLYELVAGQPPFAGSVLSIFAQILHAAPPAPSALRSGLGLDFDYLCVQAMAKRPDRRFPGAGDFALALENYLSGTPIPAVAKTAIHAPHQTHVPETERGTLSHGTLPPPSEVVHRRCPQCGQMLLLVTEASDSEAACPRCRDFQSTAPSPRASELMPTRRMEFAPAPPHRWAVAFVVVALLGPLLVWLLLRPDPTRRINSLGMALRYIPMDTFTHDFWMGETEVTNSQFRAFVEAKGYKTTAETDKLKDTWKANKFSTEDKQPVMQVTWLDAVAFCEWLSEKERVSYTLPTEAEWEHACRAGTTTEYSFGDDPKLLREYAWFAHQAPPKKNPDSLVGPGEVGTKRPNPWGLCDMHGNVWEWCLDREKSDPPNARSLRGGSYNSNALLCRSSSRETMGIDIYFIGNGFRVMVRSWHP